MSSIDVPEIPERAARLADERASHSATDDLAQFSNLYSDLIKRAQRDDPTWLEDAIETVLGITVTRAQRDICRAIVENHKILVVTANGLGKSYILAAITIVWLLFKYPAVSFATSGTEKKMKRTYCKPIKNLHEHGRFGTQLPGQYKHSPERIEFEENPEHYFEATSPEDAGELEGVHSAFTLSIIEEADKKDVDGDTVDAMDSLASDPQDRIVAIANPPEDESNVVYDLWHNDPTWEVVQFSSFESHNVLVERGEVDGEPIDGLATLWKIKQDWLSFTGREWPGYEAAKTSQTDISLDKRWFRRRLGLIPPAGAGVHRPITTTDAEAAHERSIVQTTGVPAGIGLDVARHGGDKNVLAAVWARGSTSTNRPYIQIVDTWRGTDHNENEARVRRLLDELGTPQDAGDAPLFPTDAIGEGSGLADRISTFYPEHYRFKSGSDALDDTEYKDKWSEGLSHLGDTLGTATYGDTDLREQLLAASRVVEYERRYYSSRDDEVLKATSKSKVEDQHGSSPDHLDAAMMACWAAQVELGRPTIESNHGGIASF